MSNIQIPNLPAVASLSGDELFEGVQAGSSVKISLGQMIAAARTGIPTTVPLPVSAGGTGVTTSTGTGSVVLSTNPTINNPTLVNASISLGSFGLGTAGAPSITFTGDTNTGIWSPGADNIAISTGGTERMRIDADGDVGIGTNNPVAQMHVYGASQSTAAITNAGSRGGMLRLSDSGSASGSGGAILFSNVQGDTANSTGFAAIKGMLFDGGSNTTGSIAFSTRNAVSDTALTERMRIDSAGNVGIGTIGPINKLHIVSSPPAGVPAAGANGHMLGIGTNPYGLAAGVITDGSGYLQATRWDGTATNYNLLLQPNGGNAGVGTVNPLEKLHVNTASGAAGVRLSVADVSYGNLFSSASGTTLSNITAAPLIFSTTNTERMRVHSNGGVSIGNTADPGAKNLSVTGDLYLPALTTETRSIEVGNQRSGDGNSLIDLVGDATYTDYGVRLIRNGGQNGITALQHRGTGSLLLLAQEAAPIVFSTTNTERFRAGPAGQWGIGGANYGTAGQAFISGGPSAATSWGTLGLAGGGTGVTTAPAAAAVLYGYTSTATAAGVTVLTNTSSQYQLFTGTLAQTITLPVTSTLTTGWTFRIVNNSTNTLLVQSSGADAIGIVPSQSTMRVTCILTSGTTAASWEAGYTDFGSYTGSGAVVLANGSSITNAFINNTTIGASTPTTGAFTVGTFNLGTVTAPSINFASDPNTGIWSPAADTVAVSTNGAEAARIHASGGVSIGNTTDPGATNLSVTGAVRSATSLLSSGAGGVGYSTGAGVAVTQLTSRTTPVPTTGNKTSGAITLFTTTAVVGSWFSFTVPNTAIAITDTVSLTVRGATNSYLAYVTAIVAGTSFTVTMASVAGTASDTPIVNFNIIRGVSA